ncbi:MAG: hypothetical protein U5M23_03195 [Marinagarivorans sp.]|nr:hypothetical protein [Marinagarivorans sp.]
MSTLLAQAIARVNRTYEVQWSHASDRSITKSDNRRISEALDMFSEDDGVFSAMRPASEKYQLLESRHRAAILLFDNIDRSDEDACIALLALEDVRAKFERRFSAICRSNGCMVLPDPKALDEPYLTDLKWLTRIRAAARRLYSDERFDASCTAQKWAI